MRDWVLISSLNAQNSIVSNDQISHRFSLLVGRSGIGGVL
jgi:hypothetical protein